MNGAVLKAGETYVLHYPYWRSWSRDIALGMFTGRTRSSGSNKEYEFTLSDRTLWQRGRSIQEPYAGLSPEAQERVRREDERRAERERQAEEERAAWERKQRWDEMHTAMVKNILKHHGAAFAAGIEERWSGFDVSPETLAQVLCRCFGLNYDAERAFVALTP